MFADEPTGNLDSRSGAEILELLRGAVERHGQTTVMVTHDAHAAARSPTASCSSPTAGSSGRRAAPPRAEVLEALSEVTR